MVDQGKEKKGGARGAAHDDVLVCEADKVAIELNRCPNCGASDVSTDTKAGKLKCNFCAHVFDGKKVNLDKPEETFQNAKGDIVANGASDIVPSEDIIVTLKCPSCGAEVVVNSVEKAEDLNLKCHWCRHILNIDCKIQNGAVPDIILPFKLTKAEAVEKIKAWLGEHRDRFKELVDSLNPEEDVMGVYFPYMVVDVRAHYTAMGQAEISKAPYNAELFDVAREFDLFVDDLTLESSTERLNQELGVNSNNVINAALPFDTENAVAWNPNYLRGFTSEKRNTNINDLKEFVALQSGDIARTKCKESCAQYDRGVHWKNEHLGIKGVSWKAAYLPIWLFSFKNLNEKDNRQYYVAVNARTGETNGALPYRGMIRIFTLGKVGGVGDDGVRHFHEKETRSEMRDVITTDNYVKTHPAVGSKIPGCNDERAIGSASVGRGAMNAAEQSRFSTGIHKSGTSVSASGGIFFKKGSTTSQKVVAILVMLFFLYLIIFFGSMLAKNGGSGKSYHYSSDSDYGSSSWSSSDSSWSSSSDYSSSDSGFSYSYDY